MKAIRTGMIAAVLFLVAGGAISSGQLGQQQGAPANPNLPPGLNHGNDDQAFSPSVVERQEMARQTDRQKKLVSDTDKLLALATELKADVSKTNKDVLSIQVIKKAEEIEKLAHSVKERMKG